MKQFRWVALGFLLGAFGCDSTPTWQSAFDTSNTVFMSSVWGSGPEDVFIVGGSGTAQIHHFDGADWISMDAPDGVGILIWCFGFGPDNVFAVGTDGAFVHYNGSEWRALDSGTEEDLWGVWGRSATDVWIVGGNVAAGDPVILHFDGNEIEDVGLEPSENPFGAKALFKVWGIGGKTFAVGSEGLIVELVGDTWKRVAAGENADQDFVSLWGNSEDNIVVAGGRSAPRIATYNGSTFDTVKPEGDFGGANGVFMEEDGTTFVGGAPGFVGTFDATSSSIETESLALSDIHAVWGDGTGTVYAVGGVATPAQEGIALVRK